MTKTATSESEETIGSARAEETKRGRSLDARNENFGFVVNTNGAVTEDEAPGMEEPADSSGDPLIVESLCRVTAAERDALMLANAPISRIIEIEAARRGIGGHRIVGVGRDIEGIIVRHAPEMIRSYGGRYLFSARGVGRYLMDNLLYPSVSNVVPFGMKLGGFGLNLPVVMVQNESGKIRYYDLSAIGLLAEAKAQRQEQLERFGLDVVVELIAA